MTWQICRMMTPGLHVINVLYSKENAWNIFYGIKISVVVEIEGKSVVVMSFMFAAAVELLLDRFGGGLPVTKRVV